MSGIRLSILDDCTVEIDSIRITSAAPHLFALLLLLSIERRRRLSRQDLQALLFDRDTDARLAAHNLRQLLYRVRRMGVSLDERVGGIQLADTEVTGPLELLRLQTPGMRAQLSPASLTVLPFSSTRLPPSFLEWLDRARAAIEAGIRQLLLSDLHAMRAVHAWTGAARVAEVLQALDPANEDVLVIRAEAHAMLGERESAIALLDAFDRDTGYGTSGAGKAQRMKTRVSRRCIKKRDGQLFGRDDCLSFLDLEWESAERDGARLSVILGAPGIGKTRVASEFAGKLALAGANVLDHRCDDQSRRHPLALFSHLLPELRGMRGGLGASPRYRSLLDRLCPTGEASIDSIPEGLSLEALRWDIQSALVDLIEAVSAERRMLLVVDDAHLLDDVSCAVLHALSTGVNSASLLIVACCRAREGPLAILRPGERINSHLLAPLSERDARELFLSLTAGRPVREDELGWCLAQSAGNPFYLHALAQNAPPGSPARALPIDVHSLASSLYFSLTPTGRLVLEACLFLGRFASLARIGVVTELDELALASALRELEDQDLVSFPDDCVQGPHSLLDEAVRHLIPATVGTILHRRVARVLADECLAAEYSSSLALAAAENWIAAGDSLAAMSLLRKCAHEMAVLGEPAAAAGLLSDVARAKLPPVARRELLDELIRYADVGGSRLLAAESLRERLTLGRALDESPDDIRALELRIIDADRLNGSAPGDAVQPLWAILRHPACDRSHRMRAVTSLLVIADAEHDVALAGQLASWLSGGPSDGGGACIDAVRAELVHHTTFGDTGLARERARTLIERYPEPSLDEECRRARRFAAFALYRMLHCEDARQLLENDHRFMSAHGIRSEALYAACLLTEIAISMGDLDAASRWLDQGEKHLRGATAHKLSPESGFSTSAALLAMMRGEYGVAEACLAGTLKDVARMRTARYEAVCVSLELRLHLMRGASGPGRSLLSRLELLYGLGKGRGGQDTIVEVLWSAYVTGGEHERAIALLGDYLMRHRRESSAPEWSLRHTTAADDAWAEYDQHAGRPTLAGGSRSA